MRTLAVIVPLAMLNQCLPDGGGEPPVAHIEATCLLEDCSVMQLSAAETVDGEDYEWYVDGAYWGSGVEMELDIEPRALVEVELLALNPAGSSSTSQYLFSTQVTSTQPMPQPPVAVVVIGAQSCGGYAVISTVGGCFTGPAPLTTDFLRIRNGQQQALQQFVYEPATNRVTNGGTAIGGVFRNSVFGAMQNYHDPSNLLQGNYGPPPRTYRNVVGPAQDHLTTYWDMPVGDELRFNSGHLTYLGDPQLRPLDGLSLDCTSGSLNVTVQPPMQ